MRTNFTVFAAIVAVSLAVTPMVIGATTALATPESTVGVAEPARPVAVAAVSVPAAEACQRKVRVVYSGYGAPPAACIIANR